MVQNMSITSIRLSDDLDQPLDALSKKMDRSKNYLINHAIKEFLAKQAMEDSRWLETLEALDSIKDGKYFDEADVNAWLDSWGTENQKSKPKL